MEKMIRVVSLEELAVLALLWALWGAVHSLLVQENVRARLQTLAVEVGI